MDEAVADTFTRTATTWNGPRFEVLQIEGFGFWRFSRLS